MSFLSLLVLVAGFIYSLMFCVVAYLEGKEGVHAFLSGSEQFLHRLLSEHLMIYVAAVHDAFPQFLERYGELSRSAIMFLSERMSITTQFVLDELFPISIAVMFVFGIFSTIYNYEEVKIVVGAVLYVVGSFLAALFCILNDPAKLACIVLVGFFWQVLGNASPCCSKA